MTTSAAMLLRGGAAADDARQAGGGRCYDSGGGGRQRQATRGRRKTGRRRRSKINESGLTGDRVFFFALLVGQAVISLSVHHRGEKRSGNKHHIIQAQHDFFAKSVKSRMYEFHVPTLR